MNLVLKVHLAHLGHKEMMDRKESEDYLDTKVKLDFQDQGGRLVRMEQRENQETWVRKVNQASKVQKAPRVHLGNKVVWVHLVRKVPRVHLVGMVLGVHLVRKVPRVQKVPRVHVVCKVPGVQKVPRVHLVSGVQKVPRVHLDSGVQKVPRVHLVPGVPGVPKGDVSVVDVNYHQCYCGLFYFVTM